MRPILEYANPVWDPHGIVVQEELEKVQNRAARFVTGNYNFETGSMTNILEQLGSGGSLHKRRKCSKLILLFKDLKGGAILVTAFNPQTGAVGISIQWHFKCHMLELTFIGTVSSEVSSQTRLCIICRPNHADQWTMDRSAVDQKGTFCRSSTLQTRLCADFIVNNFDKSSLFI